MTLQELFIIGEPSSVFTFTNLLHLGEIHPQLNYIDSNIICIGLQAEWIQKEKEDFKNKNLSLYFAEVDGILEIIFKFGKIYGDVAFNPRNRVPINTIENIKCVQNFIIVLSLIDKNGNVIDVRATELSHDSSFGLKESILRFENDNKLLDFEDFSTRVDELYEKYTVDDLKELSFIAHNTKKEL